jgi:hypothetical protein
MRAWLSLKDAVAACTVGASSIRLAHARDKLQGNDEGTWLDTVLPLYEYLPLPGLSVGLSSPHTFIWRKAFFCDCVWKSHYPGTEEDLGVRTVVPILDLPWSGWATAAGPCGHSIVSCGPMSPPPWPSMGFH